MQARHEKLLGILLWRGQGTWYAAVYVYDMYIPLVVVLSEVSEAATELGAKQKRRLLTLANRAITIVLQRILLPFSVALQSLILAHKAQTTSPC